jgi:hypothetical protein
MSASLEFTNQALVAVYDAINPIDDKIDFFVELAKDLQADKIIDLGCGTGLLSQELIKQGHTVIGVEPAAGMIEQAKRKYGDKAQCIVGGYLVFESRNPQVKPFTTWPYSASHETIADTPLGPVEWWCEKLVCADGYATYELHYLFNDTGQEIVSANKLRFRTYEELQASLKEAGFTIERVYGGWNKSLFEPQSPEMIFITKAQ